MVGARALVTCSLLNLERLSFLALMNAAELVKVTPILVKKPSTAKRGWCCTERVLRLNREVSAVVASIHEAGKA